MKKLTSSTFFGSLLPGLCLMVASGIAMADHHSDNKATPEKTDMSSTDNPSATIHTSMGDITVELYADKAPISTENFLTYARDGFYAGTIFHRVISNFMIQGGGHDETLVRKETRDSIQNEADNGLKNDRGTIAMARLPGAHSATSQFFINVTDNPALNHAGKASGRSWGYAVFGKVTEGMDVVDEIRQVKTRTVGGFQNVPVEPVIIESVEILEAGKDETAS